MSFFKRLFSSKKESGKEEPAKLNEIYTTEYFDKRYKKETISPEILDGCLKMIDSYFMDFKIPKRNESLIQHPSNLDQVNEEGLGFMLYCKGFKLGENEATFFLALALSDYFINTYGFKLYKDLQPEYPLRGMTVKYDKNGVVLSLYPYEYASKVLNGDQSFSELDKKVSSHIGTLPNADDLLAKLMNPEDGE